MAECPNKAENEANCTCPYTTCKNHGSCCACVRNHRESGNLPMCLRKEEEAS